MIAIILNKMPKLNSDGTKRLIYKLMDNQETKKFFYVTYHRPVRQNLPSLKNVLKHGKEWDICQKYGYDDKDKFVADIRSLAREAGYYDVWKYAIECENDLKEYFDV
jgi:hypothetical protein